MQQVATELAEQMMPSITTVTVKADMLHGSNLIAWRENLDLSVGAPPSTQLPATLVVINPGDREEPQLRASQRTIVSCQSDAVVSEAVAQVVSAPHYHPSHQPHQFGPSRASQ